MKFNRIKNEFDTGAMVAAEILGVANGKVLVKATWGSNNENIVFLAKDYFEKRYGSEALAKVRAVHYL